MFSGLIHIRGNVGGILLHLNTILIEICSRRITPFANFVLFSKGVVDSACAEAYRPLAPFLGLDALFFSKWGTTARQKRALPNSQHHTTPSLKSCRGQPCTPYAVRPALFAASILWWNHRLPKLHEIVCLLPISFWLEP